MNLFEKLFNYDFDGTIVNEIKNSAYQSAITMRIC